MTALTVEMLRKLPFQTTTHICGAEHIMVLENQEHGLSVHIITDGLNRIQSKVLAARCLPDHLLDLCADDKHEQMERFCEAYNEAQIGGEP